MLNLQRIGQKISSLRKEQHMKQNELADTLFVTHQAVSKWENGKSIPSIEVMYELTKLFNVSIDYLLDDSEIMDDDYETLLRNYPREAIIREMLQKEALEEEMNKIFYLLNATERKRIIDQLIHQFFNFKFEKVWHIFSKEERNYILVVILSNKRKYELYDLFQVLSQEEKNLVISHIRDGKTTFRLPRREGVIL